MRVKFASIPTTYTSGVLAYHDLRISIGPQEGTKNKIKVMKTRLWIQRHGILQAQNHGNQSLKVRFSRMGHNFQENLGSSFNTGQWFNI